MPLLSLSVSQLLLAFVSASILHKLTYNRFFIRWLASHEFIGYLVPSNNDLRKLKDRVRDSSSKKGKHKDRSRRSPNVSGEENEVFKISSARLSALKLNQTKLEAQDFELLYCSVDLEWIVDLALMSTFSFIITEIQFYFYPPTNEYNFSLLWALLVITYCIKTLWRLTAGYFRNEQSIGERSVCIISGCIFMLIAMIVLVADENHLELGLESAYRSFNNSATAFVKNHSLSPKDSRPSSRPVSFIIVKFTIAVICSLIGMVFTFPGLRYGQLHKALLDHPDTSSLKQLFYNLNYLGPLFIVCLWIKPLTRNLFTNPDLLALDDASFDIIRIYLIIFINVIKFLLIPKFIAIFLASSNNRMTRLRCRGGSTTNREIQSTVSSIYNYVNVVTIQYILPILMCLFTGLMFKTMGGHNWLPPIIYNSASFGLAENATVTDSLEQATSDTYTAKLNTISSDSSQYLTKILSLPEMVDFTEFKKIFSTDVFRGVFGFATWWLHFSWFCTSTIGVIYHTYFIH